MPCFNNYYNIFYPNRKKIIPSNIGELLTAKAIAYWAMDDGGYDSLGGFKFFTNSYTKTQVELLVSVLESKFNI